MNTLSELVGGPPGKLDLYDSSKSASPYLQRRGKRLPLYAAAFFPGLLGFGICMVLWPWMKELLSANSNSGWIAVLVFPFAMALNGFISDGRARHQKALTAFEDIDSGNSAVLAMVKAEGEAAAKPALEAYRRMLRFFYCESIGRPSRFEKHPVDEFVSALKKLNLHVALAGGNGRLNGMLKGTAALKGLREVGLGRSTTISVVILFFISFAVLALAVAALSGMSEWLGSTISGIFVYAVGLLLLDTLDRAYPFGTGKSSVSRAALFADLEREIDR